MRYSDSSQFPSKCHTDVALQGSEAGTMGQGRQVPVCQRVSHTSRDAEDSRRRVRRVEMAAGRLGFVCDAAQCNLCGSGSLVPSFINPQFYCTWIQEIKISIVCENYTFSCVKLLINEICRVYLNKICTLSIFILWVIIKTLSFRFGCFLHHIFTKVIIITSVS